MTAFVVLMVLLGYFAIGVVLMAVLLHGADNPVLSTVGWLCVWPVLVLVAVGALLENTRVGKVGKAIAWPFRQPRHWFRKRNPQDFEITMRPKIDEERHWRALASTGSWIIVLAWYRKREEPEDADGTVR